MRGEGAPGTESFPGSRFLPPEELGALLVRRGVLPPEQLEAFLKVLGGSSSSTTAVFSTLGRHAPEGEVTPPEVQLAAKDPKNRIGRYIRVKPLGRGGRSIVWLAWDSDLGRQVALKILLALEDPSELHRFHREAQTAARLHHPNIVPIHEVGSWSEPNGRVTYFIAMDYIEGATLYRSRPPIRKALQIIRDCAEAAHFAHRHGIIHRDIKPSNIMINSSGRPFLTDFGLAKPVQMASSLTLTGQILGTPSYMPPEQALGKIHDLDARADVYSLGATLYEIVTGRKPFRGEDHYETIRQVIETDPVPPGRLNTEVDRDVETIVLRCLDKDPDRRYFTAQELAADVSRYLNGDPIQARRSGRFRKLVKRARKNKWVTVLSACLVFAILAGLGLAVFLKIDAARRLARDADDHVLLGNELKKRWLETRGEALLKQAVSEYDAALGLIRDHAGAQRALAEIYLDLFRGAVADRDERLMNLFSMLTTHYDKENRYGEELDPSGTLELDSEPTGAEAILLTTGNERTLGTTPLEKTTLPRGSYLVVLRKEGYRDVRYPVFIHFQDEIAAEVRLYTEEEIGKDFIYVPAGSFLMGGENSLRAGSLRVETTGDFFISRLEVTMEEYLEFLNDLRRRMGPKAAKEYAPRGAGYYVGEKVGYDSFDVLPHMDPQWPVFSITWDDALAYCDWLNKRAEEKNEPWRYRLPTETEWEKAARGVDGRSFPWGNHFLPTFCSSSEDPDNPGPRPLPVGSSESDKSPYGVFDMAGSAQEWCGPGTNDGKGDYRTVRGGSYAIDVSNYFRCASRSLKHRTMVETTIGFRLVRYRQKDDNP